MTQRHFIQNGVMMLVTTNVKDRYPLFRDDAFAREAIDVLYRVKKLHPFDLYGFVIMPDHWHFLVQVPEKNSISRIMNRFKMGVSHGIGIGPIWQGRFFIRIVSNSHEALRYVHNNPVKAGFVEYPENYPWSSASGRWDVGEFGCL